MKDKAAISHEPPFRNTPSSAAKRDTSHPFTEKIHVRRIPLQEIVVFDIREDELDALINGVRVSNYQAHATLVPVDGPGIPVTGVGCRFAEDFVRSFCPS